MLEFIKMFGLGILYTLLLPFIIAIFAAYLVYVFFNYLVIEAKTIFGFFFGYTFCEETELEIKLEKMKNSQDDLKEVEKQEIIYDYQGSEEDCFNQVENFDAEKGSDEQ